MSALLIPAYAKINLTLDILGLRSDGYHSIRSIMQTIALHDTLAIAITPNAAGVILEVDGDEAEGVPRDGSNIAHRAASRLLEIAMQRHIAPANNSGLHIALTKRIPSQAGLGGGSSDCAAVLMAVNKLLDLNLAASEMSSIAASLGSDVPFFLTGGTARVEGRGEGVTPLAPYRPSAWLVIVKPPVGVCTPSAYAALDAQLGRASAHATETWEAGQFGILGNDFHKITVEQNREIAAACDAMASGDGEPPLLCGSGAALHRLMPSEYAAHRLADHVREACVGKVWVAQFKEASC